VANKSNFTVEEWDLFRKIPILAGFVVMSASPSGPFGVLKESSALLESIQKGLDGSQSELMQVLAEDLKANLSASNLDTTSPDAIRSEGLAACRQISRILHEKTSEQETAEFKTWLVGVAQRVAESAKEGGFLGFGGVLVSEEEASAIDQIQIALR
jgi:hypothetical protein